MNISLVSWNGHNINDTTNFIAKLAGFQPMSAQVGVINVSRYPNEAKSAGQSLSGVTYPITINIMGTLDTGRNTLGSWFDEHDQNQYVLLAKDTSDSDKQYYVMGRFIGVNIVETSATQRVYSIYVDDPVWKAVTATTNTLSVTASGQYKAITPGGNRLARPIITIKPTGAFAGTSYAYHRRVGLYNNVNEGFSQYYIDITNGGLDTAALVTAGKMQADGDDLRVIVDGKEVPRWLGGMNTSATKVWIQLNIAEKCEFTISADMLATGTADIEITDNKTNEDMAKKLKWKSVILIGTEKILVRSYNSSSNLLSVLQRGYDGTTAATHSAGDTAKRVEHDIVMQYGNASAAAPVYTDSIDAEREPCFNLATSTNTSRVFDTYFNYNKGEAPEGFVPSVAYSLRKTSTNYTKTLGLFEEGTRSTAMGMSILIGQRSNKLTAENAALSWVYHNPCGIDAVSSTGKKYRNTATFPSVSASLMSSIDFTTWVKLWTEASPASVDNWTAWTNAATAVTDTHKYIKFEFEGSVPAITAGQCSMEVLTCTVTLVSANCPTVSLGAETGNYPMQCTLYNNVTGDKFYVTTPMLVNSEIVIDTETHEVTVNGKPNRGIFKTDTIRSEWFPLIDGVENKIYYTQTGTGNVTLTIVHSDRKTL